MPLPQRGPRRFSHYRGDPPPECIMSKYSREDESIYMSMLHNHRPLPQVTPVKYNGAANKLPEGVRMSNLENALRELREKRSQAQIEIDKLDQIISGIESLNG